MVGDCGRGKGMLIQNKEEFITGFRQAAIRLGEGYIIAMLTDRLYIQELDREQLGPGRTV